MYVYSCTKEIRNNDPPQGPVARSRVWRTAAYAQSRIGRRSFIARAEERFKTRYTRQALSAHERIAIAYRTRKNALRNAPSNEKHGGVEVRAANERIVTLEAQMTRLEAENMALNEQFVRSAFNASTRGLGPALLDRHLPSVDREATRTLTKIVGGQRGN